MKNSIKKFLVTLIIGIIGSIIGSAVYDYYKGKTIFSTMIDFLKSVLFFTISVWVIWLVFVVSLLVWLLIKNYFQRNKRIDLKNDVERSEELFITLKSDVSKTKYCTHCFDDSGKLMQLKCSDTGQFDCRKCKTTGIYDREKYSNYISRRRSRRRNSVWDYSNF